MSPQLNQPFALARGGDFVTVATPMAFVSSAVALAAGLGLVVLFRYSRTGREWRAYADDPLAAEMMGVSPTAITARAFALAGALAGLAGATMTAAFGAVGYGLSATLTLKALAAAIVGGIGSLPGAFLGGLIVGAAETGWSALFPIDYRDIAVYALLTIFHRATPLWPARQKRGGDAQPVPAPVLTWRRRLPHPDRAGRARARRLQCPISTPQRREM